VYHRNLDAEIGGFPQRVPPGDYVVLDVEDNGIGMSPEVLAQSVDPFFTTKDVGSGTGLGLPMVFGIVQGHQGHLSIDSRPGVGTCVSIYLPRRLDRILDEPLPDQELDPDVAEPESGPGQSILVIDDEEAILDVIRRFLELAGHHVSCATNGRSALELIEGGHNVDLIILDLMMPREDALSVFECLRQRRPNAPVLLCTGLLRDDVVPELLRHPSVFIIRKPFRMNELWYAVRQALAVPSATASVTGSASCDSLGTASAY
jgi:CheY-like chemotaxis protein